MEFYAKYKQPEGSVDNAAKIKAALRSFKMQANGGKIFITVTDGDHDKLFAIEGVEKWSGPLKLKYDFQGAIKAGAKEHPQHCVEQMGFMVSDYESEDGSDFAILDVIGDEFDFPDYITIVTE